MNWLHIVIGYLLLANVVTFITYGIDKYKAKKEKWRISEATLLLMAESLATASVHGLG